MPTFCRWSLAFIFLWAGAAKLFALPDFSSAIENYRILPQGLIAPSAFIVATGEVILASLLVLRPRDPRPALLASLLSCAFLAFNASALIRGIDLACGCFGATPSRVSIFSVLLNLLMVIAGGYLASRVQSLRRVTKILGIGSLLIGLTTWAAITFTDNQFSYKPITIKEQDAAPANVPAPLTTSPTPNNKVPLSPQAVTFSPQTLEFGEIRLGESVTRKVMITNHSDMPLTVTAIGVGCQCTTVSLPSKHFAPGTTSEMNVNYKAGPETGAFKLSIGLKTKELSEPLLYSLTVTVPANSTAK